MVNGGSQPTPRPMNGYPKPQTGQSSSGPQCRMKWASRIMVQQWTVDDVCTWLEKEGFGKYRPTFSENAVDGACLLDLTQADIKSELEIPVLQDRKDIWRALQRLKDPSGGSPGGSSGTQSPLRGLGTPFASTVSSTNSPSPGKTITTSTTFRSSYSSTSGSPGAAPASPPSPQGPSQVCCKCGKPIGAAFLKAFDRLWHEECFTCTACHHPIRDMKYARKGLDPYHADCLALDQGDICFKCLQAIVGPVTSALGKKWHAECFTCGACKRPITEKAFTAVGDVPYHAACEPPRSVTPPAPGTEEVCAGCQRPIVGGVTTTALGKVWHADCFVCCLCGRPIREDKFKTDNGKPQHINCKLGDTEVVCFGCKRPITTGDIINALGEVWHADCFKCHLCGIRIMGEKFAREGDRPVHPHCKLMAASEA